LIFRLSIVIISIVFFTSCGVDRDLVRSEGDYLTREQDHFIVRRKCDTMLHNSVYIESNGVYIFIRTEDILTEIEASLNSGDVINDSLRVAWFEQMRNVVKSDSGSICLNQYAKKNPSAKYLESELEEILRTALYSLPVHVYDNKAGITYEDFIHVSKGRKNWFYLPEGRCFFSFKLPKIRVKF